MANENEQGTPPLKVGILWRYANSSSLYQPWLESAPTDLEFTVLEDYHVEDLPMHFDVLVTHMHYRWDELACLRKTMEESKTAVLVMADGILEYRNSWLNPKVPIGSMLRPAFAHKIAAIGLGQARLLETWGNLGRCEVVGLPRLDSLIDQHGWRGNDGNLPAEASSGSESSSIKLLICSATTPAFDDQQWQVTLQAFTELHAEIDHWNEIQQIQVEPTWRVAREITEAIGLPASESKVGLHEAINAADAVITTPSTIQLEAMICRKPAILLDYFSTPNYVSSAWNIQQKDHVHKIFQCLCASENPGRNNFQDFLLREQLWIFDSATERMLQLIRSMGAASRQARENSSTLGFAQPILPLQVNQLPSTELELSNWLKSELSQTASSEFRSSRMDEVEFQAALHRATTASQDRAQLKKIEATMYELQNNYEESLEEKRLQINEQVAALDAAAERHQALNELLEARNAEISKVQNRVQELAAAREDDHKMLAEAHADAKAKQQRVNELRERNQVLLGRIEDLKNRASGQPSTQNSQTMQNLESANKQLQENNQRLIKNNESLQQANENLKQNNKRLLENAQPLLDRIEELNAERKTLYERLKKLNSVD